MELDNVVVVVHCSTVGLVPSNVLKFFLFSLLSAMPSWVNGPDRDSGLTISFQNVNLHFFFDFHGFELSDLMG